MTTHTVEEVQTKLKALGLYGGKIDGDFGEKSEIALKAYQTTHGLRPDGDIGPRTLSTMFPEMHDAPATIGHNGGPPLELFDAVSAANLAKAHPLLQKLLIAARKQVEFRVLDSTRGEKAQTIAYNTGKSKARFGQSAHNYKPSVACDLFPAPFDWNNTKAFDHMAEIILSMAKAMGISIRWGGDWHMDGSKTTNDAWDKPHVELHPWRDYTSAANLVRP